MSFFSRKPTRVVVTHRFDDKQFAKLVDLLAPPKPPAPEPVAPPSEDDAKFRRWADRTAESPEERGDLIGKYAKATGKRPATQAERIAATIFLEGRGAPMPALV